jgi:TRAP-type mannitol/chloroaromatic compound transport system permease large subunit
MGVLSLPVMLKRGYKPQSASGIIMASGTLGQIIPPSIVLVLLGSVLNVPIGNLFMASVFPGVILVLLFLLWIITLTFIKPESVPAMPDEELEKFKGSRWRKQSLIMPEHLERCDGKLFSRSWEERQAAVLVGSSL